MVFPGETDERARLHGSNPPVGTYLSSRPERAGVSRLAVTLVALIVLTAGCSGLSGGDGSPDREPYDVDGEVNASAGGSEELLPGLTTEGVTNSEMLQEAHHEAIGDRTHTLKVETEYVIEDGNGTFRRTSEMTLQIDPEAGVVHEVVRHRVDGDESLPSLYATDEPNRTVERWFGEKVLFMTEFENGTVEYTRPQYDTQEYDRTDQASIRLLAPLQSLEKPTTAGAVESDEGTYYVVEGEEDLSGDELGSNRQEGTLEARTLVREDGLVRQTVAGQIAVDGDGNRTVINQTAEITDIGETTVERPDWYEEAVEAEPEALDPDGPEGPESNESAEESDPEATDTDDESSSG